MCAIPIIHTLFYTTKHSGKIFLVGDATTPVERPRPPFPLPHTARYENACLHTNRVNITTTSDSLQKNTSSKANNKDDEKRKLEKLAVSPCAWVAPLYGTLPAASRFICCYVNIHWCRYGTLTLVGLNRTECVYENIPAQ